MDFSVVNDLNYYNGLVFKGFISGVPTSILSGGQYDKLMKKMKRSAGAIGFAIYLDELSKLDGTKSDYDIDIAIEYGDADKKQALKIVYDLVEKGNSVLVEKKIPSGVRYKQIIKL